ncbi:hypothetical protein [Calothrix sp. CCY 0018]|uniref:hypothetical protein n=1 Tax=Calothrix sp. CCY 0018 TaxID=3103864 RepID=UPI0039C5DD35
MSVKLKFLLVFTLSVFATAVVAGVYKIKQWHSNRSYTAEKQQQIQAKQISSQELATTSFRSKYKSIPLTRFRTVLRGSDPAALAINAFDTTQSKESKSNRKVEVTYPQPNHAMVTITQTNFTSQSPKPIKYRVELTSFGRSLFVTSPPLWQIVWAGSYEQCLKDGTTAITRTSCR